MSDSSWLFRACKIVDGWFRQLERLVRAHTQSNSYVDTIYFNVDPI